MSRGNDWLYLDYAATTPLDPIVAERMREVQRSNFANPASNHAAGRESAATVAAATTPCERARLQQMLQQNASIVPPTVAASAHTYVEALQVAAEIPVGDGDSPMEAVPQTGIALGGG